MAAKILSDYRGNLAYQDVPQCLIKVLPWLKP